MTHHPIPRHIISHNGLCFTLYLVRNGFKLHFGHSEVFMMCHWARFFATNSGDRRDWARPGLARRFETTWRRRIADIIIIIIKYYTPERQCVACVNNLWIVIISVHTSRFGNRIKQIWQPLLFINGYLRMEYTLFQNLARKIPRQAQSGRIHRNLATGPC